MSSNTALFNLLQAYSALKHPRLLSFPSHLSFPQVHHFVLSSILLNPHLLQYPPANTYQLSFWKWEDDEIDQRLYDRLLSLVAISKPAVHGAILPPPPSFVTHYWKADPQLGPPIPTHAISPIEHRSVTLFESRTTIENGTTGLRTWGASFVLAQVLIRNPILLANKSVLELGSGAGFLGLIVADIQVCHGGTMGSSVLYLTDVNEDALRRCHENTQLPCSRRVAHSALGVANFCQTHLPDTGNLFVKSLGWSDALAEDRVRDLDSFMDNVGPDLVLGADTLYHPDMIAPFLTTLNIALHASKSPAGGVAYLALTVRNVDLLNTFIFALANHNLSAEELPDINTDNNISFVAQSEGTDQEVRVFKVVLRSRLQRNLLYNSTVAD
ncbi:hypothetical protein EDB83DRAFT_2334711 [Lactarius deliciosus]|nr:hypothetical protein EDB83DRAFT_2334711 [Lactarius deliciosus]